MTLSGVRHCQITYRRVSYKEWKMPCVTLADKLEGRVSQDGDKRMNAFSAAVQQHITIRGSAAACRTWLPSAWSGEPGACKQLPLTLSAMTLWTFPLGWHCTRSHRSHCHMCPQICPPRCSHFSCTHLLPIAPAHCVSPASSLKPIL